MVMYWHPMCSYRTAKEVQEVEYPSFVYSGWIHCWDILHGSYTIELFNQFIETWVIPNTNPFPRPNSVLIMDNAKIHRNEVRMAVVYANC